MNILESGGCAAALQMERLREAQRRLEPLHVSPETTLLYREQELLALLLGETGGDEALRSVLESIERNFGGTPEGGPLPRGFAPFSDYPVGEERKDDATFARVLVQRPGTSPGAPHAAFRAVTEAEVHRILESAVAGDERTTDARQETPPERAISRHHDSISPGVAQPGLMSQWTGDAPGQFREGRHAVTADDATPKLESRFGADERMARGWDQPLSRGAGSAEVMAILDQPAQAVARVVGASLPDSVSRRLQEAVDRTVRARTLRGDVQPLSASKGTHAETAEAASEPVWDTSATAPSAGYSFGEPPRESGLRRLATLWETKAPDRPLSMTAPNPPDLQDTPPFPVHALWDRDDLGREVADIFRREALRHGIVPEEEGP